MVRQEKWVINQRRIIWPGGMCLIGQNVWMMPSFDALPVNKGWETGLIVSFTTAAYDNMARELRENFGMPFEKDHLRNRLKTLKNNFKECFDIFNGANGFVWTLEP
ncbi:hypothetical protein NC652_015066 [Populus alba x Populus x berolinensis]|nr:hypothetical protein NC652_015066 [Populus alba x Populus x berolinensis]